MAVLGYMSFFGVTFLLLPLLASTVIVAKNETVATEVNHCWTKLDCQTCIVADSRCAWCSTRKNETERSCDYLETIESYCVTSDITYPRSHHHIDQMRSLDINNQLTPEKIVMELRPGQPQTIQVNFKQAQDYPLDIYFLMDMSNSMRPYKNALSTLAATLATELQDITTNFFLGFGSFVDKPTMPFTKNPDGDTCGTLANDCTKTYGFKHHMSLASSEQADTFKNLVSTTKMSSNLDFAEGGFDAIMQAAVCKEEIGWRNESRKIIVFCTDAVYHQAGEGKLAGIVMPNDGLCHLKRQGPDMIYDYSLLQDYPSVAEINQVVRREKINILFAITEDEYVQRLYKRLSEHVEGSSVGTLTNSIGGGNIMQLVRAEYRKITSSVALQDTANDLFKIKYQSACLGETMTETRTCQGLRVGSEVSWNVTIELLTCPLDESHPPPLTIHPQGLNEDLTIEWHPLCHCPCQETPVENSPICNGSGTLICGVCACHLDRVGHACECEVRPEGQDKTCIAPNSGEMICSGRGKCVCGQCECLKRQKAEEIISGQYCECDNYNCAKDDLGRLCGGHGSCDCGQCRCETGWFGEACKCSIESCRSRNGKICNDHGTCQCGGCLCDQSGENPYFGKTCEECPSCRSPCHMLKDCVQCQAFGTGHLVVRENTPGVNSTCHSKCSGNRVSLVGELIDELGFETCRSFVDNSDFCSYDFAFSLSSGLDSPTVIKVQERKDCPQKVNPYVVVGGLVGVIVFIGLLLLLAWKVAIVLYDRRQVKKFREELKLASWQATATPGNRPVSVAFHNASFRRRKAAAASAQSPAKY